MTSQTSQERWFMAKRKVTSRKDAKSELLSKKRWQLQSAKAQFSEVFRRARSEGPQWVTRQDKEAVVMLAAEEYERISALSRQPKSLIEFFARSPLAEVQVDLERQPDYGREVEL